MKIFTTEGIRRIDEATIERESIKMLDLMERAASAVVYQIISRWHPSKRIVIFDGFPRTIPQAEALDAMLEKRGTKLNGVIGLDVPEDILIARLLNRGKETGRSDDNLETITSRLEVYNNQTSPLKEFYAKKGLLHMIEGTGGPEAVFELVKKAIESM